MKRRYRSRVCTVYAGARAVLVWLGKSENDSGLAMTSIPSMYDSLKDETSPFRSFEEDLRRLNLPPEKHPVWRALAHLACGPGLKVCESCKRLS
jgi:hypothetical protein